MQGAHLSEDTSTDREVHEARLSADMAARVAAVSAVSQLAQIASQQPQASGAAAASSDAQHAGMLSHGVVVFLSPICYLQCSAPVFNAAASCIA